MNERLSRIGLSTGLRFMVDQSSEESENTPARAGRLAGWLVRWRWYFLPLTLLLWILAWPVSKQLTFDRSIESLYATDDPHLEDYLESKSLFGGDELVIVAYTDPDLFADTVRTLTKSARRRIEWLAENLSTIPGVKEESTQDLASAPQLVMAMIPGLVKGILLGHDGKTTAVVLRLEPQSSTSVPRGETIERIRDVAAEFEEKNDLEAYVVGEPVQVEETFRYVEEDGRTLFRFSLILLGLVLTVLFQSVRWVMLPILIVVVTITWTEAILVMSGVQLSMVSSMLNSLVTIIGVATVSHLAVHYREIRRTRERESAIALTLSRLLPAIFWTCATTAVGFAALLTSHVSPVKSFGMMMSLATVLVLGAVCGIFPGGALLGRWDADPRDVPAERHLVGALVQVTRGVKRYPIWLALTFLGVVLFAAAGFWRLQVETDFSKNFRDDSPIVRGLRFVEAPEHFAGAGNWEVNFPAPKNLTEEYLEKVAVLAERLRSFEQPDQKGEVTKVLSLTDATEKLPKRFVLTPIPLERQLKMLEVIEPEFVPSLYNAEAGRMRIILRGKERQPAEQKLDLIRRVEKISQAWANEYLTQEFPDPQVKVTGLFVLLANLIQSLLADQLVSFTIAAVGIGGMMTIAFRSLRIGLIALFPNVFPIVVVIGGMGWLGLKINIATAMIASVSMGLTVDSSIHYIAGYLRARASGLSVDRALEETHGGVGRALVFANVALIVGFSVLTYSHFIPLVYFGILVSVAMLGGLAGNLLLLPLLLRSLSRNGRDRETADANG